jgi:hypothetical protein
LNYNTAWNLLQKLIRAMICQGREALGGTVEVDETLYGGFSEGQPGRSKDAKVLIIAAVELKDKGILGRIRLGIIEPAKGQALLGSSEKMRRKGATGHAPRSRLPRASRVLFGRICLQV